jgi:hypothetical protein
LDKEPPTFRLPAISCRALQPFSDPPASTLGRRLFSSPVSEKSMRTVACYKALASNRGSSELSQSTQSFRGLRLTSLDPPGSGNCLENPRISSSILLSTVVSNQLPPPPPVRDCRCSIIGYTARTSTSNNRALRGALEYRDCETRVHLRGPPTGPSARGNLPWIVIGALTLDEALDLKLRFTFLNSGDIFQRRLSSTASASPASTVSCSTCLPSAIAIARRSSRIVPRHFARLLLVP